jgi:exodeoxyribonuclease VII large subunit
MFIPLSRRRERLAALEREAAQCFRAAIARKERGIDVASGRLRPGLVSAKLGRAGERLDTAFRRASRCMASTAAAARARLEGQAQLLRSLSHRNVLDRGFALVRGADGAVIRRCAMLGAPLQPVEIEFADGRVSAHTGGLVQAGEGPISSRKRDVKASAARASGAGRRDDGNQGSLL